MPKILILGSNGLLGSAVLKYFTDPCCPHYEVKHSTRTGGNGAVRFNLDNMHLSCIHEELHWADYVINCIGVINKHMDGKLEKAIYVNALFPHELARACRRHNTRLIHITTDCVFSGQHGKYIETSLHDAYDSYGKSKSLGEPDTCMVLRTSIIGPENGTNFSFVGWLQGKAGQEVDGYVNHKWNGVTTKTYANICDQIIEKDIFKLGTYHVFSPRDVTKYEMAETVNQALDLDIKIRPHKSLVDMDRTLRTMYCLCEGLEIPDIEDQINSML